MIAVASLTFSTEALTWSSHSGPELIHVDDLRHDQAKVEGQLQPTTGEDERCERAGAGEFEVTHGLVSLCEVGWGLFFCRRAPVAECPEQAKTAC